MSSVRVRPYDAEAPPVPTIEARQRPKGDKRTWGMWWDELGPRQAKFYGVWADGDRVIAYRWLVFMFVTQLTMTVLFSIVVAGADGGRIIKPRSDADTTTLQMFLVFHVAFLVMPPLQLYTNLGAPSQTIIESVVDNPTYRGVLTGWFALLHPVILVINLIPVLALAPLNMWVAVLSFFVNGSVSLCAVGVVASYLACIQATVRIIQRRTEWCERLMSDALEGGVFDHRVALTVVRTHGSSLNLVNRVSDGSSTTLSMMAGGMVFSVSLTLAQMLTIVETDELAETHAYNLATDIGLMLLVLGLPAWLSYTAARATDRLRSLCTASIEIGQQALSVAQTSGMSTHGALTRKSALATGTSPRSSRGGGGGGSSTRGDGASRGAGSDSGLSVSGSDGSSGDDGVPEFVVERDDEVSGSELSEFRDSNAPPQVMFADALGTDIHRPNTLFAIPSMALRPPSGEAGRVEAVALAQMAAHLSSEPPAYTMFGVKITVGLIAKLSSTFLSVGVVFIRLGTS